MADDKNSNLTTVAECRQAVRLHEWELLRLIHELSERRRRTVEHRRAYQSGRAACARIWRRCRDRVEQIELMRDLIRSSPDGKTVVIGQPVESIPAGVAILERLGELLDKADTESERGLRATFRELAALQEFAKDFFDYAGVQLVHELGEMLDEAARESQPEKLRELIDRVAELISEARKWFE